MASRATNGTLQVGLLSIPIAMRKISDPKEVKFDRAAAGGEKITRSEVAVSEVIDAETAEITTVETPVEAADIQYGVYDESQKFHPISSEAIKEIEEATKLTVFEITEFVPLSKVPRNRARSSYYLTPQSKAGPGGAKPMALLHRAMVKTKTAAVTKICLTKRQYLAVVYPEGAGLFITIMEWAEDWAQADAANVLEGVQLDAKMVDVAVNLVKQLTVQDATAALDAKQDDLRVLRAKLRDDALASKPYKAKKAKAAAPAPDGLLAALEESLKQASAV